MIDVSNFQGILDWITGPNAGGLVIILFIVSWQLEKMTFWTLMNAQLKQLIVLVFAIAIALVAVVLQQNPAFLVIIAPYWRPVGYILAAYFVLQTAHKIDKNTTLNSLKR